MTTSLIERQSMKTITSDISHN